MHNVVKTQSWQAVKTNRTTIAFNSTKLANQPHPVFADLHGTTVYFRTVVGQVAAEAKLRYTTLTLTPLMPSF